MVTYIWRMAPDIAADQAHCEGRQDGVLQLFCIIFFSQYFMR